MTPTTIKVSFPIFDIASEVQYQSPRIPTVFERMVLRLCARYGDTPEIRGMTLLELFEDKFGVMSARELIGPSVEDLLYLSVLERPPSHEVMDAPIHSLRLTPDGYDFWRRNRLPSRRAEVTVRHLYDPLQDTVSAHGRKAAFDSKPGRLYVDAGDLEPIDCSPQVRTALDSETYPWKTASTEIHSVRSKGAGVLWASHSLLVGCDPEGVLSISAPASPSMQRWLSIADAERVWQWILAPLLLSGTVPEENAWLSGEDLRNARSIGPLPASGVEPRPSPEAGKPALRIVCEEMPPAGKDGVPTIVLRRGSREVEMTDHVEPIAYLPRPPRLPDTLSSLSIPKSGQTPMAVLTGHAKVLWAGHPRSARLAILTGEETGRRLWEIVLPFLDYHLGNRSDPEHAALPALWEAPEHTISRWLGHVQGTPLPDLLDRAERFENALARFAQSDGWKTSWRQDLSSALAQAISAVGPRVSLDRASPWLSALAARLPHDCAPLQQQLLARVDAVQDPAAITALHKLLHGSVSLPESIVGDSLLRSWADGALDENRSDPFVWHPFAADFEALRKAHLGLCRDVGVPALTSAGHGYLNARGLKASALQSAQNWLDAAERVRCIRQLAEFWSGTRLEMTSRHVETWKTLVGQALAPPCSEDQRLIVFDTNVLMDKPDILTRMPVGDVPVIPKRVLEELDGIKQSGGEERTGRAGTAQQAIRAIEQAGNRVRFEQEAPGLLPADWPRTPDNRILSVVLRLRLSRVILVTSDVNLRNKARAENIRALPPSEYLVAGQAQERTQGMGGRAGKGRS